MVGYVFGIFWCKFNVFLWNLIKLFYNLICYCLVCIHHICIFFYEKITMYDLPMTTVVCKLLFVIRYYF